MRTKHVKYQADCYLAVMRITYLQNANTEDYCCTNHFIGISSNFLAFSQEIKQQDFSPRRTEAEAELNKAIALLLRMEGFSVPVHNQSKAFEDLRAKIQNFDDKLTDLHNHTVNAVSKAIEVGALNDANNNSKVMSTVEKVKNLTQEANSTQEDANELLRNASAFLSDARDALENLRLETEQGQDSRDRLNETLVTNQLELYEVRLPVQKAEEHALKLEAKVSIMIVILCPLKVHIHLAFIADVGVLGDKRE